MEEPILIRHFTINSNKQPSALSSNIVLAQQINQLNQALKPQLPEHLNQLNLIKLVGEMAVFTINSPAVASSAYRQKETLLRILNSIQNKPIASIKIKIVY